MSYETVLEQIKAAPTECLDEISQIISYVVFRHEKKSIDTEKKQKSLVEFFGAMNIDGDPLEIQKEMRSEWN